jgi:hypothetical protein
MAEWLKTGLTPSTVITLLMLAGGFIATNVRNDAQIQEIVRRLTRIEQNYVPRAEHDSKDSLSRSVVDEINRRLDRMESVLETRR